MLNICLIQPPSTDYRDFDLYFPLALITLGAMIKRHGFTTEIIDFDFLNWREGWSDEEFLPSARRYLEGVDSEIFGITTVGTNYPIALLLAALIKEINPTAKVILGGPQASLIPLETLQAFPAVDLIVCGEGEETLIEILQSDLRPENLQKISGLALRLDGRPTRTATRKLVASLDEFPPPDYSLIPFEEYLSHSNRFSDVRRPPTLEAGRGCPHACTFCSTSVMWSHKFRIKSPRRILEEMEILHTKYGYTVFELLHDNFTASPKWLAGFCDYLSAYANHLLWSASARIDLLDEKRLAAMKKAGCQGLLVGVETASPRIQELTGRRVKLEDCMPNLKYCIDNGIVVFVDFMLGFPDETLEEMEHTISTASEYKHLRVDSCNIQKVSIRAGTQLYKEQLSNIYLNRNSYNIYAAIPDIPEVWEIIAQHPHLFSIFYDFHNPHVSNSTIDGLVTLFQAGINYFFDAAYFLIHQLNYRPSQILHEWNSWCEAKGYGKLTFQKEIASHFPEFVKEITENFELFESPALLSAEAFVPDRNLS